MNVKARMDRLAVILSAMDTVAREMIATESYDASGRFLNLSACLWIEAKATVKEHGAYLTIVETLADADDKENVA